MSYNALPRRSAAPAYRLLPTGDAAARPPRRIGSWAAATLVIAGFAGVSGLFKVAVERPDTVFTLGAILLFALCIIRWPVSALYITLTVTIILDTFAPSYVQSLLTSVNFFSNLSNIGLPAGITNNMFEIILSLGVLRIVIERLHKGQRIPVGAVGLPVFLFGGMVVLGEVNGLLTGGDFKISLWEIRPLLYLVLLYFIAANAVKTPTHVRIVLWITMLGTLFRSLDGIYRYMVIPLDIRVDLIAIIEHDDSLFLAGAVGLLIAAVLWRRELPKAFFPVALLLLPISMIMLGLNKRRAAFLCLFVIIAVLLPYIWMSLRTKALRRRFLIGLSIFAVIGALYTGAFWNSNGPAAEPAQAIRSYFQPDDRDYQSNLYRDEENTNLRATIDHSPIIGVGFGKEFDIVTYMVDLRAAWPLQRYMPHNNQLWIWMRTGWLGFGIFWSMIGATVLLVAMSLRLGTNRLRRLWGLAQRTTAPLDGDPATRVALRRAQQECAEFLVLAVMVQVTLASWLVLASVDQGLMSPRLSAYAGGMIGTLAGAWQFYQIRFRPPAGAPAAEPILEEDPRVPRRRVRFLAGV